MDSIGCKNATIFYTIGFVWIASALYFLLPAKTADLNTNAVIFAILLGVVSVAAIVGFNIALTTGKVSVVVPVTALIHSLP